MTTSLDELTAWERREQRHSGWLAVIGTLLVFAAIMMMLQAHPEPSQPTCSDVSNSYLAHQAQNGSQEAQKAILTAIAACQ